MSSHDLNSVMLYIHPPLAIAGEILVFLFAALLSVSRYTEKRATRYVGWSAWLLTLAGLVSGAVWAQIAWGSYWSWAPTETSTLLLFLSVTVNVAAYHEGKMKLAKWVALASCFLAIVTISLLFTIPGLHSYA